MTKITSGTLEALLRVRFPAPRWATFRELRQATGFGDDGRIDFVAFSTWPSDGDRTVAFEIKVSRADYKREIENPKKREWVEKQFGECYFVTPRTLVAKEELPDGWGLLEATKKGDKLRQVRIPRQSKVDIGQKLMRSVLRKSSQSIAKAQDKEQDKEQGEGLRVSIAERDNALYLLEQYENKHKLERDLARNAYAPLSALADLAGSYGIEEWSRTMVRDLVARAAKEELKKSALVVKGTHAYLGRLIRQLEES